MDFMGIGPLELVVILIIGFLLFGPDKLPKMAATAGRLWHRFKKATFDLTKTIAEEAEFDKGKEEKATRQLTSDKKDK